MALTKFDNKNKLLNACECAGRTPKWLAGKMGISYQSLMTKINGVYGWSVSERLHFAELVERREDELFQEVGE